ncbi:hypothetical protein VPH35_140633 [Triticum aestivum]|uniref:uncharacterized protein n=1 Tax=Triticum aestivum TaxID=4565 RepID=UPI000842D933|nr:uncharacterized protein LOC123171461 [Triticum aestivum]
MAGAEVVVNAWKGWGLQALVLLSFMLQVTLLILAEFRRFINSGVLRVFVWLAYTMADATAIYVLGHMSVTSMSPEHELMALWASFLLLHLGGQDNITAYAIEDNRLWLRHLQTLAVQVAAAAYVIYQSSNLGRRSLLWPATILVFVVGVLKYGERVWALRRANSTPAGHNYRSIERFSVLRSYNFKDVASSGGKQARGVLDTEAFLQIAHQLLEVPKELLLEGSLPTEGLGTDLSAAEVYKVVEMQLSLMHDVFYTKTPVMHNWHGLCIRITSLVATVIALLLFQLSGDHKNLYKGRTLDVAVTYVLLVGAVILEITSVLRVMFSSGTYVLLKGWSSPVWYLLARVVASLRRLVHAAEWRRRRCWSRSMGQHNMIQLCARSKASRRSKVARWIGVEDSWNMLSYSTSIPVSAFIEQLMVKQLLKLRNNGWSPDEIIMAEGREALQRWGLYGRLDWSVEESIVVWHLATDLYLSWWKEERPKGTGRQDDDADLSKAVEALSNYMMFLLAARPSMLPPPADRNAYVQMCYTLLPSKKLKRRTLVMPALEYISAGDLVSSLRLLGNSLVAGSITFESTFPVIGRYDAETSITGAMLGARLIGEDELAGSSPGDMLKLIVQVWLEMLFYVGSRCSAYSHAKQLSNGSELITVAALLVKYITRGMTTGVV